MFSVSPTAQGGGIGKRMLSEAERIAREVLGCRRMRMTVIDCRDELIAFYERRGYRRSGVKKPFPYGNPRYGMPKRDDLRFETLEKPLQCRSPGKAAGRTRDRRHPPRVRFAYPCHLLYAMLGAVGTGQHELVAGLGHTARMPGMLIKGYRKIRRRGDVFF